MTEPDWTAPMDMEPIREIVAFPSKDTKGRRAKGRGHAGFEGSPILWCSICNEYKTIDEKAYTGVCPDCGNAIMMMRCSRCDHTWWLRTLNTLPAACPRCKSPYWCRTRVRP